jgi:phospholipid/cholesterol/gamma-HCH transport system substrate-binding protein
VKDNLGGAVWRLAVFVAVCLLAIFGSVMVFAQMRFQAEKTYKAEFTTVSGLENGNFVRIAGVEVGKVKSISVTPDAIAVVEFSTDDTVVLTEGTRALIRYDNLIGGRYLELQEGAGAVKRLEPGKTIPVDRTEPALDLDALVGGFRPLFRALDPEQVNALSGQLIQAFQGQGATISSFLAQTASFTSTLADRDELIGQVLVNLNSVLGSLGDQSEQLDSTVGSLSQLVEGLQARKAEFAQGLTNISASGRTVADLLQEVRPPLPKVVHEADRTAGIIVADHEYVDNLLDTLPNAYQALSRQGMYGDYFSFYLCDAVLKLNGKGGQPVFVKVAGQSTGRCAPK